jgi:hypothetical protein
MSILMALDLKFCLSMSVYITWFIIPSIKCRLPTPAALIQPHTSTLSSPCFTVGIKFLDFSSLFFFRHTMCLPSDPNMLNLLSSEKMTCLQTSKPLFLWSFSNMSRFFKFTLLMNGFFLATRPLYPAFIHSLRIVLGQALIPLRAISTLTLGALKNGSSFIIREITALSRLDNTFGRPVLR